MRVKASGADVLRSPTTRRGETTERDPQLIAYLETKFGGIDRRLEEMRGQMELRFEETQEQIHENRKGIRKNRREIRHTTVLVEEVRSEVKAVAEGHSLLGRRLDRIYEEVRTERQLDRTETRSAQRRLRERVERLEAAG